MLRSLGFLFFTAAGLTAVIATASQLAVGPSVLQAGGSLISTCDQDGVSLSYSLRIEVGRITVSDVDVHGIDRACGGKRMLVVLTRGGLAVATSAHVPIPRDLGEGVPVRVPLTAPFPDTRQVDGAEIVIGDL